MKTILLLIVTVFWFVHEAMAANNPVYQNSKVIEGALWVTTGQDDRCQLEVKYQNGDRVAFGYDQAKDDFFIVLQSDFFSGEAEFRIYMTVTFLDGSQSRGFVRTVATSYKTAVAEPFRPMFHILDRPKTMEIKLPNHIIRINSNGEALADNMTNCMSALKK